jgi:hypothetical protein
MKTLLLSALIVVAFASNSFAISVNFVDHNRYWGDNTSWTVGQKWATDTPSGSWDGNNIDVIGDPNITGGTAVFTSAGKLQSVSFNYYAPYDTWNMLAPGNLFINTLNNTSDTTWDYIVNTRGIAKSGTDPTEHSDLFDVFNVSTKNISAQQQALNSNYVLSGKDNTGEWSGYIIRDNHPIELSDAALSGLNSIGSANFSGFPNSSATKVATFLENGDSAGNHYVGTATYNFGSFYGGGLDLGGKNIILAWETTCANDVIYEQVNNPVPEPGTMMLLGFGMLGMAIYGKRRMNKEA